MNKDIRTKSDQAQKTEIFYYDCQNWRSKLWFMEDETIFINRLLTSYVFEPNTPDLFERLQEYLNRLKKSKTTKSRVLERIIAHEKNLGGMFECKDQSCDLGFERKHKTIEAQVVDCIENFQTLKTEIFNYAGSILKKRKPY
ncbi:hypothetical protein [uncultured Kriegella sp.]|uniref:hypothetical protein n=1 Tax=uncultured Kriegella sp. TaxID=1798910 RepID=UPI0030D74D38|tara:strand:- start:56480 stop:56905 length:426 start_codon:yes stop_codon:yes gene_type:complete